ncbi:hypothetical protein SAMD00024442_17_33 [Candidatus Symbiothrix dinenymphae]|nr:hypothetical protein SAMD00024442_17_33 [Candidatus Symbiothrix dinenymphae]
MGEQQYINAIQSLKNLSFQHVREVAMGSIVHLTDAERDALYKQLDEDVALLDSHELMCQYLQAFGNMHEAKMQFALEYVSKELWKQEAITVIDYGCGQALATMVLADYMKAKGYDRNKIKQVILIEPSEPCLERAKLHVQTFLPQTKITTICKYVDDLTANDLEQHNNTVIHLFSNIIDVESIDLAKFANNVKSVRAPYNEYVCASPYIRESSRGRRMDEFVEILNNGTAYFRRDYDTGQWLKDKEWTCSIRLMKKSIPVPPPVNPPINSPINSPINPPINPPVDVIEKLKIQLKETQSKLFGAERQNQIFADEINASKIENARLYQEILQQQQGCASCLYRAYPAPNGINELYSQFIETRSKLFDTVKQNQEFSDKIDELHAQLRETQSKLLDAERKNQIFDDRINELHTQLRESQLKLSDTEKQNQILGDRINALNAQLREAQIKLSDTEKQNQILGDKINALDAQLRESQLKLSDIEKQNQNLVNNINELNAQLNETQSKLSDAERQNQEFADEINQLNTQLSNAKKRNKILLILLLLVFFTLVGLIVYQFGMEDPPQTENTTNNSKNFAVPYVRWQEAGDACTARGAGWRLPTQNELTNPNSIAVNRSDFDTNGIYWTSTNKGDYAYTVYFGSKNTYSSSHKKTERYAYRCVKERN